MGILHEDVVVTIQAEKPGESTVITVNCPYKTGLGCDLCRVILLFGLSMCREDAQTDRKRCYLVFWAVGKPENQQPKPPGVFLLKFWCSYDREGLLHGTRHAPALPFHSEVLNDRRFTFQSSDVKDVQEMTNDYYWIF